MNSDTPPSQLDSGARLLGSALLDILRCPLSHAVLEQKADELWCRESRRAYPIRNGIPVMLDEEARDLSDAELQQ